MPAIHIYCQDRLREEIHRVIGKERLPAMTDKHNVRFNASKVILSFRYVTK